MKMRGIQATKLQINKMASIAIMIGGALINVIAFVRESYLAKCLSGDQNSAVEEERHDLAVEKYQAAFEKKQENLTRLLYWIATNNRVKEFCGHRLYFEAVQESTQSRA